MRSRQIIMLHRAYFVLYVAFSESVQYAQLVELLASYPNLDKLLGGIALAPTAVTAHSAKRGLDTLIYLKISLATSRSVAETLQAMKQNTRSAKLLGTISSSLWSDELSALLEDIDSLLVEHVGSSLKTAHQIRHEECFAIKPGIDGLLDVARKTFLQTMEEIHGMAETYSRHVELDVKVAYSTSRGYYLVIPATSSTSETLPDIFIQAVLNRRSISCTTYEVLCLSDRAIESINQAVSLTNRYIQDLLEKVRDKVFAIYAMIDSLVSRVAIYVCY
ncbi:hypothetical protein EON64_06820 [archaeon]|nr:MAG: hypothetical protein EON64_06820 [archaeon]